MPWCASAPHHITSIFLPVEATRLEIMGSKGAGIAVEPQARICLGGNQALPATAERAVRLLGIAPSRNYTIREPLPPAKGYAVSASTAIAAALATVQGLRGKGVREALDVAHKAEILENTGLGDVLAISCGIGIVYRLEAGEPGIGKVTCKQLPASISVFTVESEQSMHTRALLEAFNSAELRAIARRRLNRVFEDLSFESFVRESQSFTLEAQTHIRALGGLAERIRRVPGMIGFYSKKLVTVVFVEKDHAVDARDYLLSLRGVNIRVLEPSSGGPRVWWE